MPQRFLALLLGLLCLGTWAHAQEDRGSQAPLREKRNIQIQLLTQSGGGVSLGYHFTDTIYLGFSSLGAYSEKAVAGDRTTLKHYTDPAADGLEYDLYEEQARTITEVRLSFWGPFFFSVGKMDTANAVTETLRFDKRSRTIGNTSYTADMTVKISRDPISIPMYGLGVNWQARNGLSLGLTTLVPWTSSAYEPSGSVTVTSSETSVTDADKEAEAEKYAETYQLNASIIQFAVGYNF